MPSFRRIPAIAILNVLKAVINFMNFRQRLGTAVCGVSILEGIRESGIGGVRMAVASEDVGNVPVSYLIALLLIACCRRPGLWIWSVRHYHLGGFRCPCLIACGGFVF